MASSEKGALFPVSLGKGSRQAQKFVTNILFAVIKSVRRACNLIAFTSCLTGPVDYPFASCHKGPRVQTPRGYLCETGGCSNSRQH
jgi:hypothetical protein